MNKGIAWQEDKIWNLMVPNGKGRNVSVCKGTKEEVVKYAAEHKIKVEFRKSEIPAAHFKLRL